MFKGGADVTHLFGVRARWEEFQACKKTALDKAEA